MARDTKIPMIYAENFADAVIQLYEFLFKYILIFPYKYYLSFSNK